MAKKPKRAMAGEAAIFSVTEVKLFAAISCMFASSIIRRLFERGIINDEDIDAILNDLGTAELGASGLERIPEILAAEMRRQFGQRPN